MVKGGGVVLGAHAAFVGSTLTDVKIFFNYYLFHFFSMFLAITWNFGRVLLASVCNQDSLCMRFCLFPQEFSLFASQKYK